MLPSSMRDADLYVKQCARLGDRSGCESVWWNMRAGQILQSILISICFLKAAGATAAEVDGKLAGSLRDQCHVGMPPHAA